MKTIIKFSTALLLLQESDFNKFLFKLVLRHKCFWLYFKEEISAIIVAFYKSNITWIVHLKRNIKISPNLNVAMRFSVVYTIESVIVMYFYEIYSYSCILLLFKTNVFLQKVDSICAINFISIILVIFKYTIWII